MRIPIFAFAVLLPMAGCSDQEFSASAVLPHETKVTLSMQPMMSLQSDWYRNLTIKNRTTSVSMTLFEDTGWWQGSNLFIDESGTYILHEGQSGCQAFTVSPPAFVPVPDHVCVKLATALTSDETGTNALGQYPKSRFYPDLFYVGRFEETRVGAVPIRFVPQKEQPEAELPEIL